MVSSQDATVPRRASKTLALRPCPDERLLRHVLGEAAVARDPQREAVDPSLEALDEGRGRVGVSHRQAVEQRVVGDIPHRGLRISRRLGLRRPNIRVGP